MMRGRFPDFGYGVSAHIEEVHGDCVPHDRNMAYWVLRGMEIERGRRGRSGDVVRMDWLMSATHRRHKDMVPPAGERWNGLPVVPVYCAGTWYKVTMTGTWWGVAEHTLRLGSLFEVAGQSAIEQIPGYTELRMVAAMASGQVILQHGGGNPDFDHIWLRGGNNYLDDHKPRHPFDFPSAPPAELYAELTREA